jgi:hypothetical protein
MLSLVDTFDPLPVDQASHLQAHGPGDLLFATDAEGNPVPAQVFPI